MTAALALAAAAALGAASVLSFAPFGAAPVAPLALAGLFALWSGARSPARAALTGLAFGLGLFVAGTSWIHGGLARFLPAAPAPLRFALVGVLQAAAALFPAAAGLLTAAAARGSRARALAVAPAAWTLAEWARGNLILGGFGWLTAGYSQVPSSPLGGFVPLAGIHGASLAVACVAAGAAAALAPRRHRERAAGGLAVLVTVGAGALLLRFHDPTAPSGAPLRAAVVQQATSPGPRSNEAGELAASDAAVSDGLALATAADLVIFPEGASRRDPVQLPTALARIQRFTADGERAVLLPAALASDDGDTADGGRPRSAALLYTAGGVQRYDKHHLVPGAESLPGALGWLRGTGWGATELAPRPRTASPPLTWRDQRIAVMICFEDAFGGELRARLGGATLLASASNLGWFDSPTASAQHLQMSQARALETGRPVLRAANGGTTAVIDHRGRIIVAAPGAAATVISAEVAGRRGLTAYARWGDAPVLLLCLAWLALVSARNRRPRNLYQGQEGTCSRQPNRRWRASSASSPASRPSSATKPPVSNTSAPK